MRLPFAVLRFLAILFVTLRVASDEDDDAVEEELSCSGDTLLYDDTFGLVSVRMPLKATR